MIFRHPRTLSVSAATLAALFALMLALDRNVVFVDGSSMLPSLRSGQLMLVDPLVYWTSGGPRRGDVIVFRRQISGADNFVVKRVIGVPGDLVQITSGKVYVNGDVLDEPYVLAPDDYTYPIGGGPLRVPVAAYFVLGDNRPSSTDSRLGWFVPAHDVMGRAEPLPALVIVRAGRFTT